MTFLKFSLMTLAVLTVSACVENSATKLAPIPYNRMASQVDVDLLIEKAKSEERERIMLEIGRQKDLQKRFAYIRMLQFQKRVKPVSVNEFSKIQASFVQKSELDTEGKVSIKHCQVYQIIPKDYKGRLPAVLNSSTKIRGGKQLLPSLCRSSRSPELIQRLQLALEMRGFLKPSPPNDLVVVDGIWGPNTLSALRAYQKAEGLAYGQVSIESLVSLGLREVEFETGSIKAVTTIPGQSVPITTKTPTQVIKHKAVNLPISTPLVQHSVKVNNSTKMVLPARSLESIGFKDESEQSDVPHRSGTVYRQCWNYQVIPDNYLGTLEAVHSKSTKRHGNKQLLPSLCKSDRSAFIISELQKALAARGYLKPMPPYDLVVIDGIWGINTLQAVKRYQRDHGLAYGQLSIEVMRHLEIPDFMTEKNKSAMPSSVEKVSRVTESARAYTQQSDAVEVISIKKNQQIRATGVTKGKDL